MSSFKQKVIRGFKWSAISQVAGQALNLVFSLVLARLLLPEYFGLIVMANVTIGFLSLFVSFGLESGIIQLQVSEKAISTIFWINLVVGAILGVMLLLFYSMVADFYGSSQVGPVIQFLSVKLILTGLSLVPIAVITKRLDFKFLAVVDLISVVIAGSTAVFLAYYNYGVQALVWQVILQSAISTFLVIFRSKWVPKFHFSISSLKEVTGFTKFWFFESILNYGVRNVDSIIIGKFLNSYSLGIYNKSLSILSKPIDSLTVSIGKVLFPSLARIKDDNKRIKSAFLKVIGSLSLIIVPISILLFVLSENLVLFLIGEKWKETIPVIKIFCLLGLFRGISAFSGNLFIAKERTDLTFKWGTIRKVFVMIGMIIGLYWGIIGVAWGYTLSRLISFFWLQHIAGKLVDLYWIEILETTKKGFLINLFLFLLLIVVHGYLKENIGHLSVILVIGMIGLSSYIISLELSKESHYLELKKIILSPLRKKSNG